MTSNEIEALVCDVAGVSVERIGETLDQVGFDTGQKRDLFRARLRQRLSGAGLVVTKDQIPNESKTTLREIANVLANWSAVAGAGQPAAGAPRPEALPIGGKLEPPRENFATVRIFYATDRASTGSTEPAKSFAAARAAEGELNLGTCDVSIPRDHRMGKLEAPAIWRLEFRQDPEKHVVLLRVDPLAEDLFFQQVRSRVADSERREMFVFIHGFNVSFADAARRTAQLAYDLGFAGAPILYSWPSYGDLWDYPADENNVQWSAHHLAVFLEALKRKTAAQSIHLIAHSMGNRCLTGALAEMAAHPDGAGAPFREIVLTAPDIDTGIFLQLAGVLRTSAQRVTLYASSKDRALALSQKIHRGPRAGESGPHITVCDGIDTVDASAVDTDFLGHSYFAEARSVVGDLWQLFRDGKGPGERFGLQLAEEVGRRYWCFVP